MSKKITFLFFSLLFFGGIGAQVPDSLKKKVIPKISAQDTLVNLDTANIAQNLPIKKEKKKNRKPEEQRFLYKVFKKNYPNPKMALFTTMAVPGLGQIYNKSWWKVPLVWGGMTWAISSSIKNTRNYRIFKNAYISELAKEEHQFSNTGLDAADLKRVRDGYDNNRQVSYIMIFVVYVVAGAEAFVDSHLKTFDVSDDLSLNMNLKPSFETDMFQMPSVGVSLSFQLSKKEQRPTFLIMN